MLTQVICTEAPREHLTDRRQRYIVTFRGGDVRDVDPGIVRLPPRRRATAV